MWGLMVILQAIFSVSSRKVIPVFNSNYVRVCGAPMVAEVQRRQRVTSMHTKDNVLQGMRPLDTFPAESSLRELLEFSLFMLFKLSEVALRTAKVSMSVTTLVEHSRREHCEPSPRKYQDSRKGISMLSIDL